MKKLFLTLGLGLLVGASAPTFAQQNYPTPQAGVMVPGTAQLVPQSQNSAGQWIFAPATASNPSYVGVSPNSCCLLTVGTPGSPSSQVVSIQGVGLGTPIPTLPTAAPSGGANYTNITTLATTVVKSGPGVLYAVTINSKGATSNTAKLYDNTAASGTTIGTLDTTSGVGGMSYGIYGVNFLNGLTVVTAAGTAADITVVWK